jgi:hypothetical protein
MISKGAVITVKEDNRNGGWFYEMKNKNNKNRKIIGGPFETPQLALEMCASAVVLMDNF